MTRLSDTFMLDLLRRAQPYQALLTNAGFATHIDSYYGELDNDHYISFDVTVFYGHEIMETFYFSPFISEAANDAELSSFVAFANSHC